ncbi:MAG: 3-keto-disaccharide hydrolase [Akkermansiaceae bacterium]
MIKYLTSLLIASAAATTATSAFAQNPFPQWKPLFNGKDLTGWTDVNTSPETWSVKDGVIICHGKKIGVMRSNKQYENFILHIEWKHMEPGGNSGTFVWADGTVAKGKPFPKAVEVQMLELSWPKLNPGKDGKPRTDDYVHGEMWGIFGLKTTPDNPRGNRSSSIEKRCKPHGQWNTYDVVCIDGIIKLSVNGKFVNGISGATQKKGYICLESEGAEIHFRNIKIMELPGGVITPEQTAPVVK